jgi:hypothetical protein
LINPVSNFVCHPSRNRFDDSLRVISAALLNSSSQK